MYVYLFFFFCFFATAFRGTTPTAFRGTLKVLSWRDHDFSFESANFFCILSFQLLVFNVSFPYYICLARLVFATAVRTLKVLSWRYPYKTSDVFAFIFFFFSFLVSSYFFLVCFSFLMFLLCDSVSCQLIDSVSWHPENAFVENSIYIFLHFFYYMF